MAKYLVKFFKGTFQQYNSITPNDYTFYYLTDVDKIYLGDVQLSNSNVYAKVITINSILNEKANIYVKTTRQWNEDISLIGETNSFYIYTDRGYREDEEGNIINIPGIKIGDGSSYLIDLPFIDETFYNHISTPSIHVSEQDRQFWNNKVRIQENDQNRENQDLVFTIH